MPISPGTTNPSGIAPPSDARAALRRWAIGVCSGFVFLILAGSALGIWHLRNATLAAAEQGENRFALLAAERTTQGYAAADLALKTARSHFAEVPLTTEEGRRSGRRFLANVKDIFPQVRAVVAYDTAGFPTVSTLEAKRRASNAGREFFQVHRKPRGDSFYVGNCVADALAGQPMICFSRPLFGPNGGFGGVIVVIADTRYVARLYDQLRLRPTDRLRVESDDGRLLISLPEENLESRAREGAPRGQGAGFARQSLPAEPDDRIVARRAVRGYPAAIALSWSRDAVLAEWRVTAAGIAAGALAACGLLAVLCALLVRQLQRLDRADDELRDSRTLLQNVVDTVPHALYVKDRGGTLQLVNATSARMIHLPVEQLVGRNIFDLTGAAGLPEQHPSRVLETDEEVLASGKPVEFEAVRQAPEGTRRMRVIKSPIRDASGEISSLLLLVEDITARWQGEEELRTNRQLLATILDTIPHHVWTKDRNGRLVHANRSLATYMGKSLEEMKGQQVLGAEFRPPEENARIEEEDRRVLQSGDTVESTDWYTSPNSERRRFQVIKCPLLNGKGQIDGLVAISLDITEQARAEEALRTSQTLLQTVFDNAPVGIVLKDPQGRYVLVNREVARQNATTPERMVGTLAHDHPGPVRITPAERELVLDSDRQALAGEVVKFEISLRFPTGSRRLNVIKAPIRDATGRVSGILVLREDVTEQRKAEDELRVSQRLLTAIVNTLPQTIVAKDPQGRYLLVNRAKAKMHGIAPEAFVGKTANEIPWPDPQLKDAAQVVETRVLTTGKAVETQEVESVDLRGETTVRRFLKLPLIGANAVVEGTVGISFDQTKETLARRELQLAHERLADAIESFPGGFLLFDGEDRLLVCNSTYKRLMPRFADFVVPGVTGQEILRRAHTDADGSELSAPDGGLATALSQIHDAIREFQDVDGRWFRSIRSRTAQGGMISVVIDINERVLAERRKTELEREVQQLQKMELIGRLAAGVAHDFNNLLTPIYGHAELMLSEAGLPESIRSSADVILRTAERAAELTRGLLAFGRKQVLDRKELCLNDAVRTLQPILGRLIGKNIEVHFDLAADLGWVLADSSQIQQVLLNLCVNARDAMPNGGVLVIGTQDEDLDASFTDRNPDTHPGPYVMLYVSDTGQGMEAETLAHIFEPFFTTKGAGKGTGLGLSIVHGIVQQHGGAIRVFSAPGQGTTFRVYLPRIGIPAQARAAEAAGASPVPRGSERIIVVEDEDTIRKLVCTTLGSYGYAVTEAPDPEQALDLANRAEPPFAALVTDLVMPNMSGLSLYRKAAELHPDLRVLYISGHPRHLAEELGYRGVGPHFLTKPFSIERLARAVRETLDA
ncbi:MAG: PAS domain-containing protein [SAR324 cluster bacterium]